jgi:hypothetical protein
MMRRGSWRLAAVGLATILLPACITTHRVNREMVDAAPPETAPPPTASFSPYAMVHVGPLRYREEPAWLTKVEKVPLEEFPRLRPVQILRSETLPPPMPVDVAGGSTMHLVSAKAIDEAPTVLLPPNLMGDPPLVGAMRCYLNRRPDQALAMMKGLDPLNQEMLLRMLPLAVRMAEAPLGQTDPQQLAADVEQLQSLLMSLRPRAALVVDKLCFCRQVKKFGVYEALDERPTFHPGELVEVYAEVRNVSCERHLSKTGEYLTHMASKVEIRAVDGSFDRTAKFDKTDPCHTPQYDYYQQYRFSVPSQPGKYMLRLEVTDQPTERKVERTLEFQIRE